MQSVILVFLGGGLGSALRYGAGKWISGWHSQPFPWGTLVVNVAACFILGYVVGMADHRGAWSPATRLFWVVGFCGGFSTFSAFSYEALLLLQRGFNLTLLCYILLSLVLCVGATFGGLLLAE